MAPLQSSRFCRPHPRNGITQLSIAREITFPKRFTSVCSQALPDSSRQVACSSLAPPVPLPLVAIPLAIPRRHRRVAPKRNMMVELVDEEHLEDIRARAVDSLKWTCVVYYAGWCRNCRTVMPQIMDLGFNDKLGACYQFAKANIQEGGLAYQIVVNKDVRGLPFAQVFKPNGDYAIGISTADMDGLICNLEVIAESPDAVHFEVQDDGDLDVYE
eukprot:gene27512-2515_t